MNAQHRRILGALGRLEEAFRATGVTERGATLRGAIREFLTSSGVEDHVSYEEREVYRTLAAYLPPEVGSVERMVEEHDTVRALLGTLRSAAERIAHGSSPDAEAEIGSVLQDLGLVLRDHIRKEEDVVFPLLKRLQSQGVDA